MKLQSVIFCIFALTACAGISSTSATDFNIDDSIIYAVKFNPPDSSQKTVATSGSNVKSEDQQEPAPLDGEQAQAEIQDPVVADDKLLNAPDLLQTVTMTTNHNEQYVCELPKDELIRDAEEEPYAGPNILQLLNQLFVTSSCAYRLEHYWTYELCHGKYLRQYHEERDGKDVKVTEYFLGRYDKETFDEQMVDLNKAIADGTLKKPQKKRIETMNMPFFELQMKDGTICDLNGMPRTTRVQYICYPSGKHEIYQLKESSTCEYEVLVLSPLLCQHPDYKPEESNERLINCRPANAKTASKPLNLIAMEAESLKLRSEKMFQAELFQGDKGPGSVRIEIKPVNPTGSANVHAEEEEDLENNDQNWPQKPERQPMKPLMDPEVVKQFLRGDYCLYGGTGWWKYEFCYGKKVDQYHEEKGGQKTVINLGRFDLAKHKSWIDKYPVKKPKPAASRKQVSHFYSDGDICDITGKPRTVEVKLKCKKSDSPSVVSLYLLEPKTCEYILGVESPLVCDILGTADQYGLMEVETLRPTTTSAPTVVTTTTTGSPIDGKTYVKFTPEDAVDPGKKRSEPVTDRPSDDHIYDEIITKDDLAAEYDDYDSGEDEEEEDYSDIDKKP